MFFIQFYEDDRLMMMSGWCI